MSVHFRESWVPPMMQKRSCWRCQTVAWTQSLPFFHESHLPPTIVNNEPIKYRTSKSSNERECIRSVPKHQVIGTTPRLPTEAICEHDNLDTVVHDTCKSYRRPCLISFILLHIQKHIRTHQKVHVKEKVNGKDSEKEIRSKQSPDLTSLDQIPTKVQRKRRNDIDCTSCCC